MIYTIELAPAVKKVLKKWKKSNPAVFEKASKVIAELMEHPKPLRGGANITWSRHITAHDRIVYDIFED